MKPLDEIKKMISGRNKVLVAGCGGCVTICQTGGAKEAETLGRLLSADGKTEVEWTAVTRQCETEFNDYLADHLDGVELIISTACGIGVQALNEQFPRIQTVPALNTAFLGMPVRHGVFEERCQACGSCVLEITGGICPISRCSKNLMNGPCGGSQEGRCEIAKNVDCAWQLIYDRLLVLGRLDRLNVIQPPRDWSAGRDGGPRRMSREDLMIDDAE